ncbi:MAG: stage II sporulation protein M [Nanoarchaeota archaeon]|nr:stage II sporulation protein M [Nanoarchaeota archaeon]MBU1622514.1 stage II sporulation protein M [Nanoarchaeota archaeon]
MVLESLFNPFTVKKRPWEMFIAGFAYSIIGLLLSYFVFRDSAGLLMVFLIVLATLPLLYTTIKNEEELDLKYDKEIKLLKEHTKVLIFLIFLFLGITVALALAYVVLPGEMTTSIFSVQHQAIGKVNASIQGNMIKLDLFSRVFFNNLKVLFFCIIFSFLYGTGAIFILTWNASVVAAAIGNLFKTEIAQVASSVGFPSVTAYLGIASISFFRYMTHGLLEMASYFTAGLAGGIISIALIKHNLENDKVLVDALDLILISLGLLLLAGLVEVYITPALFA